MNVTADVLGDGYEAIGLFLGSDFEGEVTATLVRRSIANSSPRAVLYLHGFSDYFFQSHMADFYVGHGYDFYALDLRKNGRSLRPHQTPNLVGDLTEYFAEIGEAVRLVREVDGHRVLLLSGHGTGGLTAALWADRFRGKGLIDGLFLNSPALDLPCGRCRAGRTSPPPACCAGRRRAPGCRSPSPTGTSAASTAAAPGNGTSTSPGSRSPASRRGPRGWRPYGARRSACTRGCRSRCPCW
ncbi:alpha/beta hydrolase [Actinomadura yumaensis]|uniref:alpha/beta hydrolase n=1 Tax=Actinomadura yumaensis TaxID=111807 RepID=UPI00361C37C3